MKSISPIIVKRFSAYIRAMSVWPMVKMVELTTPIKTANTKNHCHELSIDTISSNRVLMLNKLASNGMNSNRLAYLPPSTAPNIMPTENKENSAPLTISDIANSVAMLGSRIPHKINSFPIRKKPAKITIVAGSRLINAPFCCAKKGEKDMSTRRIPHLVLIMKPTLCY